MIETIVKSEQWNNWRGLLIAVVVLLLAAFVGLRPNRAWLSLLVLGIGGVVILRRPVRGLLVLTIAALLISMNIRTGSEVSLNPVSVILPLLLAISLLYLVQRRELPLFQSRPVLPLLLFLAAGLISLLIGNATWNPIIPRNPNFLLVQLAQWAIFAFSAGAFLLTASLVQDEVWLRRLTWTFLFIAGGLAIVRVLPNTAALAGRTSGAITRAPFWMLLTALAGGQLLFNRDLRGWKRLFLLGALLATFIFSFVLTREVISNWIGVLAALVILIWLRWPRLRLLMLVALGVLLLAGLLFPVVYEFAGGDAEWTLSGATRIALSRRVIEVTMRNPVTGLGPASYRAYANLEPLNYGNNRVWIDAVISSHNNYVDLFAHVGLLGMAIFFWFVAEVFLLGGRLRKRFRTGFPAAYVNGVLAACVGALVLMIFADWILPFVYNIGFYGFQASVLVWLFMGGLVALEQMGNRKNAGTEQEAEKLNTPQP